MALSIVEKMNAVKNAKTPEEKMAAQKAMGQFVQGAFTKGASIVGPAKQDPYANMPGMEPKVSGAIQNFLDTAKGGKIQLGDLTKDLNVNYTPYQFQEPEYSGKAERVDDLPPGVKEAIFEAATGQVRKQADTQRRNASDTLAMRGHSAKALVAALRDINKNEVSQIGDTARGQMVTDAQRSYDESQKMRDLGLSEAKYKTGLADTLATRNAAEAEKKFGYDYAHGQDVVNTKMNQAQFNSAERANEASRVQASIQQGLNYMNQGGNYRLNVEQLRQKGEKDKTGFDAAAVSGAANAVGSAAFQPTSSYYQANTPALAARPRTNPAYTNPNQDTGGGYY